VQAIKFAALFVFLAWGFMFPKSHKLVFQRRRTPGR